MLKLLFFMNIMGSLFYFLHMLLFSFETKHMPPKHRVFLCRLNLLLYIFPFPICLFYIRRYFDSFTSALPVTPLVRNGTHFIFYLEHDLGFALPKAAFYEILLLLTWFIIGIKQYRKFSKKTRTIRKFESYYDLFIEEEMNQRAGNVSELIHTAEKELKLKKSVRIFMDSSISSPHIGGIVHPTIYLPLEWNVEPDVYYVAIRHELAHVKNHDLFFKHVVHFIRIINWFDPTIYRLILRMEIFAELAADICACSGVSKEAQRKYQTALVNLSHANSKQSEMFAMGLKFKRKNKSFTEERIMTMNNKNLQNRKFAKLVTTSLVAASLFTISLIPALAYNLPSTLEIEDEAIAIEPIDVFDIDILPTETDRSASTLSQHFEDDDLFSLFEGVDFSEGDFVCIDENGDISYYDGEIQPRIIPCNHNYLAARASHHDKRADGGCTITYYTAKRCSKCGHIVIIAKEATLSFVDCPH